MAPGAWISLVTLLMEYFICISGSLVETNASEIDWNSISKPPVSYTNDTSEKLTPDDLLTNVSSSHGTEHHGIHVANWRWDEIGVFFTFALFILVSGLAKVGRLL
jgi:hypothetical protein